VLDRFDDILQSFIEEYGLSSGLQTEPFGHRLLLKGDADKCKTVSEKAPPSEERLRELGFSQDGDRELVEQLLGFTSLLLDNASNRSLYASSAHLGALLCTTSISLLKATLGVALRLARRFYTTRQRLSSVSSSFSTYLNQNYQLDLEQLHKLATPFSFLGTTLASNKSKEKTPGRTQRRLSLPHSSSEARPVGSDMVSILKNADDDSAVWQHWRSGSASFYAIPSSASEEKASDTTDDNESPSSPSIRRQSNASRTPHGPSRLSMSNDSLVTPSKSRDEGGAAIGPASAPNTVTIPIEELASRPTFDIIKEHRAQLSLSSLQDLTTSARAAKALSGDRQSREDIVGIRMLAIANLAYVCMDAQFQQKIGQQDSEEPRRLQLAHQLAEMVHPPENSPLAQSKDLQTYAMWTLEALTKQKSKQAEVYTALNANVNHGILFYVVRKCVAHLASDGGADDASEEEWRQALLSLLVALPTTSPRAGDSMMSAGLLDILIEVLGLRTVTAERTHQQVLNFLDNFVYSVRDAFQSLANAKGLDAIADLASFAVDEAFARAERGEGMPAKFKNQYTDYQIPYYLQGTLRWLFKFIDHTMKHNGGTLHRQLRNLIESPQMMGSLRKVLGNGNVYGSSVWSGAVNILSNFIHNEPTSFAVVAEARLNDTFLEAVSGTSPSKSGESIAVPSILPSSEAITSIPTAFGAICLNENGLKLFKESSALEAFFKIFESPDHLKALDGETEPAMLGSAFDELVRHHPPLKAQILTNVRNMVATVGAMCFERASERGMGAKLWKTGQDGKLYVAGGRQALLGKEGPIHADARKQAERQTDAAGDVDMLQDETSDPGEGVTRTEVSIDEVVDIEDTKKGLTTAQIISVVARFLSGFFQNKPCCHSFLEEGGLEYMLDLAALPSLPYNFESGLVDEHALSRAIQILIEEKPHLALPAIIKRMQAAVDDLRPLLDYAGESAFFAPFTSKTDGPTDLAILEGGTKFAKALVVVNTLCHSVTEAFQSQMFTQRSGSNIFYQVNLADMYVDLIDSLGKLHRSCVWEEILLQKDMPASFDSLTRVTSMGIGDEEADQILGILQSFGSTNAAGQSGQVSTTQEGRVQSPRANGSSRTDVDQSTAEFKNTRTLRHLLSQVPCSIYPLFQSLGRILLVRRVTDPYQKANAIKVADQLALSAIQQLRYERPEKSPSPRDPLSYWVVILSVLSQLMMDETMERPTTQTLTLVLQSFKNHDGFVVLDDIMQTFHNQVEAFMDLNDKAPAGEKHSLSSLSLYGIKMMLTFFSRIISSRHVNDANQTQAMTSRTSDRDKPDFFSAAQFLVELRMAVLKPVTRLWDSPLMEKATTPLVKTLVDVLRMVLEGESESGALTSSDKIAKRSKSTPKLWQLKSTDSFTRLKDEYGDDLAKEAMFRCYENQTTARDYCAARKNDPRAARYPIPPGEMQTPNPTPPRQDSTAGGSTGPSPANGSTFPPADFPAAAILLDLAEGDDPMTRLGLAVPGLGGSSRRLLDALGESRDQSPAPGRQDLIEASQLPDVVTVNDLNEQRTTLRNDLIDRCLDVVNSHTDVTFEIADLIFAAVSKAPDPKGLREEIGNTLLNSLISLQIADDIEQDEFQPQAKKIASYAHLLGLVLQDNAFYEATLEGLKENFSTLAEFIKVYPDQLSGGSTSWIGQVLLILERLLSNDAQPRQIEFNPPSQDDPIHEFPIAELSPPLIKPNEKEILFNAIVDILPHIGKDESLAISVTRILVILTRQQDLATRLGEKLNLQKLFTMIRQLGSFSNDKLQSAFLLTLRHIIEDEDTIRQIMRCEIQSAFETRSQRQTDTTAYTRTLSHLVVRNPEIFVQVTNEKVMITRYDHKNGPQMLALKKEEKPAEPKSAEGSTGEKDSSAANISEPTAESNLKEKPDLERTKSHDFRIPIVEHPDGVIHFLISELLNFRDVDDTTSTKEHEKSAEPTSTDVEMSNGEPSSTMPQINSQSGRDKDTSHSFKADEHPVFIYRCFLLACLTELLSSYNKTKLEFIGFSSKRRAEQQNSTPSKPRSFVLNYLLNSVIPVGFIDHGTTTTDKKKLVTSSWAIQAIVALCTKTGERGYPKPSRDLKDYPEEPDLLLVRKFVLEHTLKAFKEAHCSTEHPKLKYSRLLGLADLFGRMLQTKTNTASGNANNFALESQHASSKLLAKIMYQKNFIPALTMSIADIDLNFPEAKRVVKYILRPLKMLTQTAVELSLHSDVPLQPGDTDDDAISTASSSELSDLSDGREETPDLFRNSALGILDPRRDEEDESSSEEEDEDEEMYDDGYADEMEYEDEIAHDRDEPVSDEEDDIEGMGPIEGLPGDVDVVVMGDEEGEDDEGDDTDDEMDEDEEMDEEDEEDMELEEVDDEGEDPTTGADDDGWGTEDENGEEYLGEDEGLDEQDPDVRARIDDLVHVLQDGDHRALLDSLEGGPDFEMDDEQADYLDDEAGEEGLSPLFSLTYIGVSHCC
jgi:E3 ubiquitin-protein ligase HUWE1